MTFKIYLSYNRTLKYVDKTILIQRNEQKQCYPHRRACVKGSDFTLETSMISSCDLSMKIDLVFPLLSLEIEIENNSNLLERILVGPQGLNIFKYIISK